MGVPRLLTGIVLEQSARCVVLGDIRQCNVKRLAALLDHRQHLEIVDGQAISQRQPGARRIEALETHLPDPADESVIFFTLGFR